MNDISDEFRFQLVNEEIIIDIINDIGSKAFGNDGLNIIIIRLCCPLIVPIIVHIMNECLLKGYFPTDWKFAKVIPLPEAIGGKSSDDSSTGKKKCIAEDDSDEIIWSTRRDSYPSTVMRDQQ
ncbi:hypothetical protein JTB14_017836 [Gonioctena quinquepunctata]|nr:hypothetical protein JTB14_017836 [Gonioctena quinquepunctata]